MRGRGQKLLHSGYKNCDLYVCLSMNMMLLTNRVRLPVGWSSCVNTGPDASWPAPPWSPGRPTASKASCLLCLAMSVMCYRCLDRYRDRGFRECSRRLAERMTTLRLRIDLDTSMHCKRPQPHPMWRGNIKEGHRQAHPGRGI